MLLALQFTLLVWMTGSASAQGITFNATHYGESYNGGGMFCGGRYYSWDTSIVAVSPAYYDVWPCGTPLTVTGPAGAINAIRQDKCGGCGPRNQIDLSEAGIIAVCGSLGSCVVSVQIERE